MAALRNIFVLRHRVAQRRDVFFASGRAVISHQASLLDAHWGNARIGLLLLAELPGQSQRYPINSRTKGISPVWRVRFMRSACRISRTLVKHASTLSLITT